MIEQAIMLWSNIIAMAAPLWLMGLGLLLCQRAGSLQWGVEGVMLSTSSLVYYFLLHDHGLVVGLLAAMVLAMLLGGLYFLLVEITKINWVLSGFAVFFLGVAIQRMINNDEVKSSDIGNLSFGLHYLVPYAVMLLLLVSGFFLKRTTWGMIIRGLGDEPRALCALYPIKKIQFFVNMIGMALIGLGMGLLVVVYNSSEVMVISSISGAVINTGGVGWLLLVVVALAAWSPYRLLLLAVAVAAAIGGNITIGAIYGLILLLFLFLLSRKDYFLAHAPTAWRKFFLPND